MSKRIVITGAAGGIGSATVALLRARGAQVVGLDLAGSDIECDVRDQASVDRAVAAAIEQLGGLDVLINNAGLGTPQSAAAPPDEAALAVLDVNLVGPWRVTSAALPALRESRGRVVNVACGLAHVTVPFSTAYTLSKRGVVAYSGPAAPGGGRPDHGHHRVPGLHPHRDPRGVHRRGRAARRRRAGGGRQRRRPHARPRRARRAGPRPRHHARGHR